MSETRNENLDSQNEEEVLETEEAPEGESAEERLLRLEEANKKLYARLKKAEQVKKEAPAPKITNNPGDMEDERLELRLQGYSKEDVGFIMQNGGSAVLEDKNSLVSIAINAKREQARAEEAADQTTNTTGMSEVERKYTPAQLKNMTAKELEEILPHTQE